MEFTNYRLPDGRIVPVDATAAKGALVIGFTLKGGRVVDAIRADAMPPRVIWRCAWCESKPDTAAHVVYTDGICADCSARVEREG